MTRTNLKDEFMGGLYNKIPNRVIAELIVKNMREIGLPEYDDEDVKFAERLSESITPDMKIAQLRKSKRPEWEKFVDKLMDDEIPDPSTATWILGTPGHSWHCAAQSGVGLGHKSLIFAAKTMAATAIDLLMNADTLTKAKKEQRQRIGDKEYRSPIPCDIKPPLDIWER